MTLRRVVTLGEALGLLRIEGAGTFEQSHAATIDTGGAEANVAIGLARLGVPVSWLGRVGDDSLGRRIRRELRAEGVETHAVSETRAGTALMLKEAPSAGRTRVQFYRRGSAGSMLGPEDVDELRVPESGWLHVTGIAAGISPTAAAAVDRAIGLAQDAGATISFDVNHRSSLWGEAEATPVYRSILSRANVAFGGDDEWRMIFGAQDDDRTLAEAVAAAGPREVVVKCGDRGAGTLHEGSWVWRDAIAVSVVDTVGAGDAFVAGYISSRIDDQSVLDALQRAVRTGAAVCARAGDWEGALTLRELFDNVAYDPVQR